MNTVSKIDRKKNSILKKKNNNGFIIGGEPIDLKHPLLTNEAFEEMVQGLIPDVETLCESLIEIIGSTPITESNPLSALRFVTALGSFGLKDKKEVNRFKSNPRTNHVLIQNDILKMVLIRWEPGASANIHGHAEGGCIFKVLRGKVTERRYSADEKQRLLSQNEYYQDSIAYIDDRIGLHDVANSGNETAITIHLYTPGNYKAK